MKIAGVNVLIPFIFLKALFLLFPISQVSMKGHQKVKQYILLKYCFLEGFIQKRQEFIASNNILTTDSVVLSFPHLFPLCSRVHLPTGHSNGKIH